MPTLKEVSGQHQQRLAGHVERLSVLADQLGRAPWSEVAPGLADEHDFLVTSLIPHMERVETAVHAELDRLLSCRLGMEPLEREHAEIRQLIERLGQMLGSLGTREPASGEAIELNRVAVKLYSMLRVHLREESMYVPILERNLSPEQAEAIASAMEHASRVEF
jgi:hypothetical protein